MNEVVDRVPSQPGRYKMTMPDGSTQYVTLERADEPTVVGTPLNKALFDSIQDDLDELNSKIGNPSNLNTTAKTNVVAAVNEVNTKVSSKVDKNGTSQVRIRRETPLTSTAYNTAPFVVEIPSGSASAPGIGFHNPNKEGAFFYLQDGKFRYMTSGGGIYEFTTERIGDAPTG